MPLALACRGFEGAFTDASTNAFKPGTTVQLPKAGGGTVPGTMIDMTGDGIADGLDLNGDGVPEILFLSLVAGKWSGLDTNGDGTIDYYLSVDLKGNFYLSTGNPNGNATSGNVAVTTNSSGTPTGFNSSDGTSVDNSILTQIYADATVPTTSTNNAGGTFSSAQTVTLSCSDNVACNAIAYTTDGSTPNFTGNGTVVAGKTATVTISSSATLRWIVRDAKGNLSTAGSSAFVVSGGSACTYGNGVYGTCTYSN